MSFLIRKEERRRDWLFDAGCCRKAFWVPGACVGIQRVAKFATKLEPSGISIRFLNFSQDREFNNLNDVEDIMRKVRAVDFDGPTRLGQILHFKIVGPMVFQKERRNTFTKPIIVMVITDGEVSMANYLGCYGGIKCAAWTGIFTLTNLS